jgi:hypothetical protein
MASARDVEMAVEAVKVNGLWLAVLREDLRAEREVVHEAVQQNGLALEHAEWLGSGWDSTWCWGVGRFG